MPDFVHIATFEMLPEAQIAIGRLDAEGIEAFLADAYLAQAMPMTITRIRLMVAAEHEDDARRILETDYSDQLDGYHEET